MNKEIKQLYEELSINEKERLRTHFSKSPKMQLYLEALDQFGLVSTTKAIQILYEAERERTDERILINRFYKLRRVLYLHLLQNLKKYSKGLTVEEAELNFLRLLSLKNEHAYLLDKALLLEKKCWEDNTFELIPDLIHLIILALHAHQSRNIAMIRTYIEKLDTANELLYTLNQFKNYVNVFRVEFIDGIHDEGITEQYHQILKKMRRKANGLKEYPRFKLLYHYTGFSIGSLLQKIVHDKSNILVRHLNQLDKLLKECPTSPILTYCSNHRIHDTISLEIKRAIYWHNKEEPKKSYQAIEKYERFRTTYPTLYLSETGNTFYNIILCCIGAKEYQAVLEYTRRLKDFQLTNAAVKEETPYYIFEILAYTGLYPSVKHENPASLIQRGRAFLKDADERSTWI